MDPVYYNTEKTTHENIPSLGAKSPVSMLIVVDLPAPLCPVVKSFYTAHIIQQQCTHTHTHTAKYTRTQPQTMHCTVHIPTYVHRQRAYTETNGQTNMHTYIQIHTHCIPNNANNWSCSALRERSFTANLLILVQVSNA